MSSTLSAESAAPPSVFGANSEASYLGLDGKGGTALLAASVRDVLVRINNVCAITGLSVPTIYRLMSQNKFPRPVKITSTARAWKVSEISGWMQSLEREAKPPAAPHVEIGPDKGASGEVTPDADRRCKQLQHRGGKRGGIRCAPPSRLGT